MRGKRWMLALAVAALATLPAGRALTQSSSAKIIPNAHSVLGRAQLPAIALPDATLAQVSAKLREKYAFFSTAADAALSTVDPNDTGADLKRLGRIAGYVRGRNVHGMFTDRPPKGLLDLRTTVTLWRDSAAARASIRREIANEKRFAGKKLQGGELVSAACSEVRPLSAMLCHEQTRSTRGTDFFGTIVIFNVDQLRGFAGVVRSDDVNVDGIVLRLAAELRLRALAAVGRRH